MIFPSVRPIKEETVLDVRFRMWMQTVKQYREKETKERVQNTDQLDSSQKHGWKSVEDNVRKSVLHVSPLDKGKGLVVMTRDIYDKMTQEVLERAQKEVRSLGRALARVFGLKDKGGKEKLSRCFENVSSWAMGALVERATAKTHKPPGEGGVPMSRPIF